MRLAGEANWWAPRPLRRLHDRFGISESEGAPVPALPAILPLRDEGSRAFPAA
jgi:RND superfamily putative drug exporter